MDSTVRSLESCSAASIDFRFSPSLVKSQRSSPSSLAIAASSTASASNAFVLSPRPSTTPHTSSGPGSCPLSAAR